MRCDGPRGVDDVGCGFGDGSEIEGKPEGKPEEHGESEGEEHGAFPSRSATVDARIDGMRLVIVALDLGVYRRRHLDCVVLMLSVFEMHSGQEDEETVEHESGKQSIHLNEFVLAPLSVYIACLLYRHGALG